MAIKKRQNNKKVPVKNGTNIKDSQEMANYKC